jgi:hypothetical protein
MWAIVGLESLNCVPPDASTSGSSVLQRGPTCRALGTCQRPGGAQDTGCDRCQPAIHNDGSSGVAVRSAGSKHMRVMSRPATELGFLLFRGVGPDCRIYP